MCRVCKSTFIISSGVIGTQVISNHTVEVMQTLGIEAARSVSMYYFVMNIFPLLALDNLDFDLLSYE